MAARRVLLPLTLAWLCAACGASEKEVRPTGAVEPSSSDLMRETLAEPDDPSQHTAQGGDDVANGTAPDPARAPTLENGIYVFRHGDLELAVNPAVGGRVTRFSRGGVNVLTGPEAVASGSGTLPNMYGSTFWTSPQSDWGWPPEAAIDIEPYSAEVEGGALILRSGTGATTGYAVEKRLWVNAARGGITLEYVLDNQSATRAAAPWEISRVPKEGLVFFPASSPPLASSTLGARVLDGVSWVDIAEAPPSDSKLFQDGSEGWLAYVHRDLLFLKLFENIPPGDQAPGEAEIEIFVSGTMPYVEIEQQGRYAVVPEGRRSPWRVTWLLLRRPAEVDVSMGSAALVGWARELARATGVRSN